MREDVPQCGSVCPSVRGCGPVWEGGPKSRRVCPSVGECFVMCEGVGGIDKYV